MGDFPRPECSPDCGQIVIKNDGGTVIINCNCCSDSPCIQIEALGSEEEAE